MREQHCQHTSNNKDKEKATAAGRVVELLPWRELQSEAIVACRFNVHLLCCLSTPLDNEDWEVLVECSLRSKKK
ncbi:unnamed protein product [Linum trigynum]|uniref:Uncharacterized protein n=1 Tax=Linum trigynum TaxID=586398 RepID=A0AAV2E189_9ROSI